jgi:predicted MFS family arabinose efflux permease
MTTVALAAERRVIWVVAMLQFINIVDFMMVMPLGPDFSKALNIDPAHLGLISGAYTAAAAITGLLLAPLLDRFPRRQVIFVAMVGLAVGTVLGAFAQGLTGLLLARVVAGIFGGPATSTAMALIADHVPAERRGRAMGVVMGAFSVASVVGVPVGLELARLGTFRLPFVVIAVVGAIIAVAARWLLPPETTRDNKRVSLRALMSVPEVRVMLGGFLMTNTAGFLLIPNLSAYLQGNLSVSRASLSMFYLVGGMCTFGLQRLAGIWIDKVGASRVAVVGMVGFSVVVVTTFVVGTTAIPAMLLFIGFMTMTAVRNVSITTLSSRVAPAPLRAAYGSLQSAAMHTAAAAGAGASTMLLTSDGPMLVGMPRVALLSVCLSLLVLPVLFWVEGRVRARGDG